MLINDCCFTKDDKYFIVHELKIYEVSEKVKDIINFKHVDVHDHVENLKYFKPCVLNLHKWKILTQTAITPCNEKLFNDHFIMVNGFIYKIKGTTVNLINVIEKIDRINLISNKFAMNYGIDILDNYVFDFIDSIDSSVIDLTNLKVINETLSLDKFVIYSIHNSINVFQKIRRH